jgi:hypothetical protein
MGSKTIKMRLTGEPEAGGSAVISAKNPPVVRGAGNVDYTCGACATIVAESMREGEIEGCLFRCPKCGCVNRVI